MERHQFRQRINLGMMANVKELVEVDPATSRLPPSRPDGADPIKLTRQLSRFGTSVTGMPPPWVHRALDGELVLWDGITRATRVAKFLPGTKDHCRGHRKVQERGGSLPTIGEKLP